MNRQVALLLLDKTLLVKGTLSRDGQLFHQGLVNLSGFSSDTIEL